MLLTQSHFSAILKKKPINRNRDWNLKNIIKQNKNTQKVNKGSWNEV